MEKIELYRSNAEFEARMVELTGTDRSDEWPAACWVVFSTPDEYDDPDMLERRMARERGIGDRFIAIYPERIR